MKTKLITIGLAMLGYLGIAHAQTLITNVSAVTVWTDTGIFLTNSEWVDVNAFGPWFWDTTILTTEPDGIIDPSDIADTWVQNGVHGSLIAFIGSDPYQGSGWESGTYQTNQYLEIGTARQFMSNTNGELWVGINDAKSNMANTNDNGGSNYVTVNLGFCDIAQSNLTLHVVQVASNLFTFSFSNGIPKTSCAIYDSADLTHWTLLDTLILDTNGSSLHATETGQPFPGCGFANGIFTNITMVPYRFYKVSNGPLWSQPIGFERITVGPGTASSLVGTNGIIADQLIAPSNTLNGLLNPMVDGTTLPNGSEIWIAKTTGFDVYTYSSGSWSPNGNPTLLPGQAAKLVIPTNSSPVTVTFAGVVLEGDLTNSVTNFLSNLLISSMIPQAGGLQSPLGYNPGAGDIVFLWVGTSVVSGGYYGYLYQGAGVGTGLGFQSDWTDGNSSPPSAPSIPGDQTDTSDGVYWAPEPVIKVGQGFQVENNQTNIEYWIRKFPGCCDQ